MLTNYHSHTQFCDGKATMEEFVVEAIRCGFSAWGISPHSPLPMLERAPWALQEDEVGNYIGEAERLKREYGGEIRILTGMEIDYIDEEYNPSTKYFQELPLDFRIGSIHLLRSETTGELVDIDCPVEEFVKKMDYHFRGSTQRIAHAYYRAQRAMVTTGGFTFVGHSDKISSNLSLLSSRITEKSWYKDLVEEYLELCAARGVVLEINTKVLVRKGLFFPDKRYFSRMAELGIPVIINSDAHRLSDIAVGLREARSLYSGEIIEL